MVAVTLIFLERYTSDVLCVSFSADGRLLASKSKNGTVQLWDAHAWEEVAVLHESASNYLVKGLREEACDEVRKMAAARMTLDFFFLAGINLTR